MKEMDIKLLLKKCQNLMMNLCFVGAPGYMSFRKRWVFLSGSTNQLKNRMASIKRNPPAGLND